MSWILAIVGAYLLGSIPFGLIIGRSRGIDIRQHGSKNIGATNVARVLGRPWGTVCFVLDVSKGAVPVLVAGAVHELLGQQPSMMEPREMWLWMAVVCAPIAGHMHSPFVGFRGGKGVATGFGAMLAMWPVLTFAAIGAMVVWYAVLRLSRYVSLASMLAAAGVPAGYVLSVLPHDALEMPIGHSLQQVIHASAPLVVTTVMALVIVYKHRANIARLRRGEEPKVRGSARRGAMSD